MTHLDGGPSPTCRPFRAILSAHRKEGGAASASIRLPARCPDTLAVPYPTMAAARCWDGYGLKGTPETCGSTHTDIRLPPRPELGQTGDSPADAQPEHLIVTSDPPSFSEVTDSLRENARPVRENLLGDGQAHKPLQARAIQIHRQTCGRAFGSETGDASSDPSPRRGRMHRALGASALLGWRHYPTSAPHLHVLRVSTYL